MNDYLKELSASISAMKSPLILIQRI